MKKKLFNYFFKVSICTALLIYVWGCRRESVLIETKQGVVKHNYIILCASDGSSQKVSVSYSIQDVNGNNKVIEEVLETPALFGGENVVITYDSIHDLLNKHIMDIRRVIKRNYSPGGSDCLEIRNLSSVPIEYCIVGNQNLTFHKDILYELINEKNIDFNYVIEETPEPIYKMAPVLYLLKPELAPQRMCYVRAREGVRTSSGGIAYERVSAVETPLFTHRMGELSTGLPVRPEQVLALYRDEFKGINNELFLTYDDYVENIFVKNIPNYSLRTRRECKDLYGIIDPQQTLTNSGKIWFINTRLDISFHDHF